jgi:hypothetical protein
MEEFVEGCLHRLPPPTDPADRDFEYDTGFSLFTVQWLRPKALPFSMASNNNNTNTNNTNTTNTNTST